MILFYFIGYCLLIAIVFKIVVGSYPEDLD